MPTEKMSETLHSDILKEYIYIYIILYISYIMYNCIYTNIENKYYIVLYYIMLYYIIHVLDSRLMKPFTTVDISRWGSGNSSESAGQIAGVVLNHGFFQA